MSDGVGCRNRERLDLYLVGLLFGAGINRAKLVVKGVECRIDAANVVEERFVLLQCRPVPVTLNGGEIYILIRAKGGHRIIVRVDYEMKFLFCGLAFLYELERTFRADDENRNVLGDYRFLCGSLICFIDLGLYRSDDLVAENRSNGDRRGDNNNSNLLFQALHNGGHHVLLLEG